MTPIIPQPNQVMNTILGLFDKLASEVIETVPSETGFGCVEYTYRLDRRSETVTSTRRTVDNTNEICEGIQDEPIVSKLGNGCERVK